MNMLRKLLRDEWGVTAIEYGLLIALIALGIVSAVQGIGDSVEGTFSTTSSAMANR